MYLRTSTMRVHARAYLRTIDSTMRVHARYAFDRCGIVRLHVHDVYMYTSQLLPAVQCCTVILYTVQFAELCVLRTFGSPQIPLVFICPQSVPAFPWDRLGASIEFPVIPKRAQYAQFGCQNPHGVRLLPDRLVCLWYYRYVGKGDTLLVLWVERIMPASKMA